MSSTDRHRRYRERHPEKVRETAKRYRDKNQEKERERQRQSKKRAREADPEKVRAYERQKARRERDRRRDTERLRRQRNRDEALQHYGSQCTCCGETEKAFLVFDHINNDGADHRRRTGYKDLPRWLKKEGWPDGIVQVLCANCNTAKSRPGGCPHHT